MAGKYPKQFLNHEQSSSGTQGGGARSQLQDNAKEENNAINKFISQP